MTRADNIRPYAIGAKYKILRDVREAVPYAVIQNISIRQIQIYHLPQKTKAVSMGYSFYDFYSNSASVVVSCVLSIVSSTISSSGPTNSNLSASS